MPRNPLFDDPFFRHFFGEPGQEQNPRIAQSLGSGVIVDPSGLVVTNHHVIEGMTDVKVALSDRREFEAEIVLRDPRTDLAVLKIKGGENFPVLELGDSDAIEVGDFVIAIGNPFGVGQTVTQGIVSALARTQIGINDYGFFIQTDAAINPGNSGGALVDTWGRLVGINSAIYSRSGGSMGIGFAIPVNMVKSVVVGGEVAAARRSNGRGSAPNCRTSPRTSPIRSDSIGRSGRWSSSVDAGSPAAEAGLKRGDVIVRVDGQTVDDAEGVGFRLGVKPLGGVASLVGAARGQDRCRAAEARRRAGNAAARRAAHQEPLAVPGRRGDEPVARGAGGALAAADSDRRQRGRHRHRRRRRLAGRRFRRAEGRRVLDVNGAADSRHERARRSDGAAHALVGFDDLARRTDDPNADRVLGVAKSKRISATTERLFARREGCRSRESGNPVRHDAAAEIFNSFAARPDRRWAKRARSALRPPGFPLSRE